LSALSADPALIQFFPTPLTSLSPLPMQSQSMLQGTVRDGWGASVINGRDVVASKIFFYWSYNVANCNLFGGSAAGSVLPQGGVTLMPQLAT